MKNKKYTNAELVVDALNLSFLLNLATDHPAMLRDPEVLASLPAGVERASKLLKELRTRRYEEVWEASNALSRAKARAWNALNR